MMFYEFCVSKWIRKSVEKKEHYTCIYKMYKYTVSKPFKMKYMFLKIKNDATMT